MVNSVGARGPLLAVVMLSLVGALAIVSDSLVECELFSVISWCRLGSVDRTVGAIMRYLVILMIMLDLWVRNLIKVFPPACCFDSIVCSCDCVGEAVMFLVAVLTFRVSSVWMIIVVPYLVMNLLSVRTSE